MNFTRKIIIRLDKLSKKTNEAPICLRITVGRKPTYKKLLSIKPEFWDSKNQQVKKGYPNYEELNLYLSKKLADINKEMLELKSAKKLYSIEDVKNKINERKYLDLFKYAEEYNKNLYNYSTYKNYNSVIKKLKNYIKKSELPINIIDTNFIHKYETYLSKELKNSTSTIAKNMRTIAKYVNDIYKMNKLEHLHNPFNNYKISREYGERLYLTKGELRLIENTKILLQSPMRDAKDIFLFQCYTGLRISDALRLRWKNLSKDTISGYMQKTKHKYNIPLIDKAQDIIERKRSIIERNNGNIDDNSYIFNKLTVDIDTASSKEIENDIESKTAIINKNLKKLAKLANVEKNISTHCGRRTIATLLHSEGADMFDIQGILGHTDIRTTQLYVGITDNKRRKVINLLND